MPLSGRCRPTRNRDAVASGMAHPDVVKYDRQWERLIEYLNEWAIARNVPGGVEVTFEQSPGVIRSVEVVMTEDDWDDYIRLMYGTDDRRGTRLDLAIQSAPVGARYLVYDTYDWVPSDTPVLPEDDFKPGPGEWVVTDDEGKVIDRFADFMERD